MSLIVGSDFFADMLVAALPGFSTTLTSYS